MSEARASKLEPLLFSIGDYTAGAITGMLTAAAVRGVIGQDMDMVLAMVIGMIVGMCVHVVFGLVISPLLGAFQAMVPGSLIGMYGGMFFAMRDSMQMRLVSFNRAVVVGAVFGLFVTAAVKVYDRALRITTSDT
ncbi:MAG: hypothetical protein ACHQ9S_10860 [Candidatus Binatia bacterium]